MADMSPALQDAIHVKQIGFAEFTTDLVLKVFDGLVAANFNQTEAYIHLVKEVSKSLKDYVNDTHDQIGSDQILAFLSAALPKAAGADGNLQPKEIKEGTTLDEADASALNKVLTLSTETGGGLGDNNKIAKTGPLDKTAADTILEAVARRISANKYDLLKEMVQQGLLRLVVTKGIIESKLTFNTYSSSYYSKNSTSYDRKEFKFAAAAKTGSALARWITASASADYSTLGVTTTNENQLSSTSSQINIFGFVHLEFKTDYLPLSA